MPRWARFLSCTLTGSVLALAGVLLVTAWLEGGPSFWSQVMAFAGTPAFWSMALLFALLVAVALLLARLAAHLCQLNSAAAGALAGAFLAILYGAFLLAAHAADWGGAAAGLHRAWPAVPLFALPFALAGGLMAWLWDRLG